ncbi:unnamed protein product [Lota lota]
MTRGSTCLKLEVQGKIRQPFPISGNAVPDMATLHEIWQSCAKSGNPAQDLATTAPALCSEMGNQIGRGSTSRMSGQSDEMQTDAPLTWVPDRYHRGRD